LLGIHSRYGLHTRAVTVFRDTFTRRLQPFRYLHDCSGASGWSIRRVGFTPTGKAPPYHGARHKPTFIVLGSGAEVKPGVLGPSEEAALLEGRPPSRGRLLGQLLRHAFNGEGAAERCVFFTDLPNLRG
jgi:hypothetical protein